MAGLADDTAGGNTAQHVRGWHRPSAMTAALALLGDICPPPWPSNEAVQRVRNIDVPPPPLPLSAAPLHLPPLLRLSFALALNCFHAARSMHNVRATIWPPQDRRSCTPTAATR